MTGQASPDDLTAARAENAAALAFPVPMIGITTAPQTLRFMWWQLQLVFKLPEPAEARPSQRSLEPAEEQVLKRFSAKAISLATAPFLEADSQVTVTVDDDGTETVHAVAPHEESERGFLTLLRQFVNAPEPASFKNVQTIAQREVDDYNGEVLRRWGRVHKKLLNRSPAYWAEAKAMRLIAGPETSSVPGDHLPRVDKLFEAYFYGDVIHFGEGRDTLDKLNETAFDSAHHRLTLHEGAVGLACYYMGFAEVLANMFPTTAQKA